MFSGRKSHRGNSQDPLATPAHRAVEGVPRSAPRSGEDEASTPEEASGWPSAGVGEGFSSKGGALSASSNVFFKPCQNPLRRSSFTCSSSRVYDGIPFESIPINSEAWGGPHEHYADDIVADGQKYRHSSRADGRLWMAPCQFTGGGDAWTAGLKCLWRGDHMPAAR